MNRGNILKYYNPAQGKCIRKILDVAIKLLYENRYNETTLRQIADTTGLKHSTILYVYRSWQNESL
ncbi:MAG: TetR/AcrR family transcriptional regulator [Eubacteriales bacterium]